VNQLELLTDPVLWSRARDGEKGSFEELVRRYARAIYGLSMALLGDSHAAEDVTQEAFTRAYERLGTCRDPSRIGAWLLSIARNCARETLRAISRVQTSPEIEAPAPSEDRVEEEQEKREKIEELRRALAALTAEEQMLLAMKYQEGMSCKEIAAHTGMSLSNVKVSIFRAYEELRKIVKL
jgi:RNA polymerase sigma factor (sigma-70 family)